MQWLAGQYDARHFHRRTLSTVIQLRLLFTLACGLSCLLLAGGSRAAPLAEARIDLAYQAARERGDHAAAAAIATRLIGGVPGAPDYGNKAHVVALRTFADHSHWQAKFGEAERLLTPLARAVNGSGPARSELRTVVNLQLAEVLASMVRHDKAEDHYRLALQALPNDAAPDVHEWLLESLAGWYAQQGRQWELRETLLRLLAYVEARHGPEDHRVGAELVWLHETAQTENYRLGEKDFRRAFRILKRALDDRVPDARQATERMIRLSVVAVGELDGWQGSTCDLRRQLIAETEKAFSKDAVELVGPLAAYAAFCEDELKYREIESLHHRAIAIALRHFGPHHPTTIEAWDHLATFYASRESGDERRHAALANDLRRKMGEGLIALHGPRSPAVALKGLEAFLQIGGDVCTRGDASCEKRLRELLKTVRGDAGDRYPFAALLVGSIAERMGGATRADEALVEKLYLEAADELRRHYGASHPEPASMDAKYARWLVARESGSGLQKAAALQRNALDVRQRHYGPESLEAQSLVRDYLHTLWRLGQHAEIEAVAAAAVSHLEAHLTDRNFIVEELLKNQAEALRILGRREQALVVLKRRADLRRQYREAYLWGEALLDVSQAARALGRASEADEAQRLGTCLRNTRIGTKPSCN